MDSLARAYGSSAFAVDRFAGPKPVKYSLRSVSVVVGKHIEYMLPVSSGEGVGGFFMNSIIKCMYVKDTCEMLLEKVLYRNR